MKTKRLVAVLFIAAAALMPAFGNELDIGNSLLQAERYSEALKRLLPLANSGNDEAQRLVGEMCYHGQGVPQDAIASFKWNELAAEGGNRIAQYNLGYLYENGQGVSASRTQAINWYAKAANQEYAPAQRKMGDLSSDLDKSIYWYGQARLNGDEQAGKKFARLSSEEANAKKARDELKRIEEEKEEAKRLRIERNKQRQDDLERDERLAKERVDDTPSSRTCHQSLPICRSCSK